MFLDFPKGVSAKTKVEGGNIILRFRWKRKQLNKSSETADRQKAISLANELVKALNSPEDVPAGLPDKVYEWLQVIPDKKRRTKITEALKAPALELGTSHRWTNAVEAKKSFDELWSKYEAACQQREFWRLKAVKAEAQLGRKISDAEARSGPRKLGDVVPEFLKQLHVGAQTHYQVTKWLNRFVRDKGAGADVQTIGAKGVVEHLAKYEENVKLADLQTYLCKFMDFATFNTFERTEVLDWMRPRRRKKREDKQKVQWFSLEKPEDKQKPKAERVKILRESVLAIIEKARELHGDYIADAMLLQYGSGFRPEEIPLIMTSCVQIHDANSATISLVAPENYRLKNTRSQDAVNVPSFAMDALRRRLAATKGKKTLFPLSESGFKPWDYMVKKMNAKAIKDDMWPNADDHFWSEMFLSRLREAGAAAGWKDYLEEFQSNLFRHVCAREMILIHGFEAAAALLRHDVGTLRAHYADLCASDVSTER